MAPWKRRSLLKTIIFRFYVTFREGMFSQTNPSKKSRWASDTLAAVAEITWPTAKGGDTLAGDTREDSYIPENSHDWLEKSPFSIKKLGINMSHLGKFGKSSTQKWILMGYVSSLKGHRKYIFIHGVHPTSIISMRLFQLGKSISTC